MNDSDYIYTEENACSLWISNYTASGNVYPNSSDIDPELELGWMEACIGAQRFGDHILWPLTVIYIVMGATGTCGNILVCHVIVRNISMRTSTNFFLFSLAVADIAILLMGATFDLSVYWQQYPWVLGEPICKLRAFLSEMTSYCSVLTILAFSFERYLAICHPLYSYTMAGLKRTARIIVGLWICSALAAAPFFHYTKIHYWSDPFHGNIAEQSAFCASLETPEFLFEGSFFLFFLLPLLALIVLYISMGLTISRSANQDVRSNYCSTRRSVPQATNPCSTSRYEEATRKAGPGAGEGGGENLNRSGSKANGRSRKAVLKMLAAVVFSFFLCWAPFHTQRLLIAISQKYPRLFEGREDDLMAVNEKLYYLTGFFYYLSSTINPIIYNMMSAKYRRAFTATVTNCCSKKSHISSLRVGQDSRRTLQSTLVSHAAGVTGRSRDPAGRYLSVSQSLAASRKGSQQSTVSFVVSQGPDRRLMDLGPDKLELDLGPDKLNTSSSDLEKLKTSSSELQTLKKSSSFELEKFQKSSADLEKLDSTPRDLPSELCKLRKELELSDLKLVESSPQKLTSGQIDVYHCDPNSNCKSGENCAECVL